MRKISLLCWILIGVGTWVGVGTSTSTASAGSTIDPFAMMVNAKNLATSHYVDYEVVFN